MTLEDSWVVWKFRFRCVCLEGSEESIDSLARVASLQNAAMGQKTGKGKDKPQSKDTKPQGKDAKHQAG